MEVPSGFSVVAESDLPEDTNVVECPFDLIITEELAQKCLLHILDLKEEVETGAWTGRQWISSEFYLTASTYLSSRAFPSSLLSPSPSLIISPDTKPILLPGIDALNHGRKQPVSWNVSYPDADLASTKTAKISLILHSSFTRGQELLNNYGAKPNSELILGYGFALSHNPDDTIVLKIGGSSKKWEIGRSARGAEGLWNEILASVQQTPDSPNYEDHLDAAGTMLDMLQTLLDRLPPDRDDRGVDMRPEVAVMLDYYVEGEHFLLIEVASDQLFPGQRDILESLMNFAREKERLAVEDARDKGIEIVLED
ncbi:hypothetical protein C0993_012353 [Termitomyces sp. T159_Od127]|nr:hypothetical protein C0993_012353 [Termitomyces sp. T159_Od127]